VDGSGRQQLLLENLAEVRCIARGIHGRIPSQVSFEDLFHAGILGLIDAVDKFDAHKNVQLKSYARIRIRGAIMDSLRKMDWGPRHLRRQARSVDHASRALATELGKSPSTSEVASKLCMSPEDLHRLLGEIQSLRLESLQNGSQEALEEEYPALAFRMEEDPFQMTFQKELRRLLDVALSQLNEKEGHVLGLYYREELTMKKIGLILGLGESRVSQIHAAALVHLRSILFPTDHKNGGSKYRTGMDVLLAEPRRAV
jgi:RNA polymerase sigma factor for flagellar operon FliA